ncbi:MAG: hypothetical protein MI923_10250 [Phycisphaerales bacterium]|nr:hypothetical protein [Phycisphaerales bacterium]
MNERSLSPPKAPGRRARGFSTRAHRLRLPRFRPLMSSFIRMATPNRRKKTDATRCAIGQGQTAKSLRTTRAPGSVRG